MSAPTLMPENIYATFRGEIRRAETARPRFDTGALPAMPRAQHLLSVVGAFSAWLLAGALIDPALGDVLALRWSSAMGTIKMRRRSITPSNDAADLAAALNKLGFATHLLVDATKREMDRAVQQFARDARNANLALFFFAGHGMQFQGHNYVLPIDPN